MNVVYAADPGPSESENVALWCYGLSFAHADDFGLSAAQQGRHGNMPMVLSAELFARHDIRVCHKAMTSVSLWLRRKRGKTLTKWGSSAEKPSICQDKVGSTPD